MHSLLKEYNGILNDTYDLNQRREIVDICLKKFIEIDETEVINEQHPEDPDEIQAITRFLAQICIANKYCEHMKPILERMRNREHLYCEKFAKKLGCKPDELAPWFFAIVASSASYLIFGQESYSAVPHDFIQPALQIFKEKYKNAVNNEEKQSCI